MKITTTYKTDTCSLLLMTVCESAGMAVMRLDTDYTNRNWMVFRHNCLAYVYHYSEMHQFNLN